MGSPVECSSARGKDHLEDGVGIIEIYPEGKSAGMRNTFGCYMMR